MLPDFTPTRRLKDFPILLVEDNAPSRQLIVGLLRALGFSNVTVTSDGEQALTVLFEAGCSPDLILCDWHMPGLDGLELLKIVRDTHREAIFIMVTATDSIEAAMLAKAHGADGYLLKPVSKATLEKVIRETVDRVRSKPGGS